MIYSMRNRIIWLATCRFLMFVGAIDGRTELAVIIELESSSTANNMHSTCRSSCVSHPRLLGRLYARIEGMRTSTVIYARR